MTQVSQCRKQGLKDIDQLKADLEEKKDEAGDKFEKFSEEMSTSFQHLKKAFKNLW